MRRRFDGCISVYDSGPRVESVDPSAHAAPTYNATTDHSSADDPTTDHATTDHSPSD
jgi:hypothetical protein